MSCTINANTTTTYLCLAGLRGLISCYQSFAPMTDIAVALPVFTYGQNWRYYLWICDNCFLIALKILTYKMLSCICLLMRAFLLLTNKNHCCISFSSRDLLFPVKFNPYTCTKNRLNLTIIYNSTWIIIMSVSAKLISL
jgi:hypothetical protein